MEGLHDGRDFDALDLLQGDDPALHQPGLGGVVAEARDEGLDVRNLLLLRAPPLHERGELPVSAPPRSGCSCR